MKILFIVFVLLVSGAFAQRSSVQAYLAADLDIWKKVAQSATAVHGEASMETAMAYYGLLNSTMATKDRETFDRYADKTLKILSQLQEDPDHKTEAMAIRSSIYGLKIAYKPFLGMFVGGKSSNLIQKAMTLDPESPIVLKLYGGWLHYTPDTYGGNAEKAIETLEKAITRFEESGLSDHWLYLDAYMTLALAHQSAGQKEEARDTLKRLLEIEPSHYWAKSTLAVL